MSTKAQGDQREAKEAARRNVRQDRAAIGDASGAPRPWDPLEEGVHGRARRERDGSWPAAHTLDGRDDLPAGLWTARRVAALPPDELLRRLEALGVQTDPASFRALADKYHAATLDHLLRASPVLDDWRYALVEEARRAADEDVELARLALPLVELPTGLEDLEPLETADLLSVLGSLCLAIGEPDRAWRFLLDWTVGMGMAVTGPPAIAEVTQGQRRTRYAVPPSEGAALSLGCEREALASVPDAELGTTRSRIRHTTERKRLSTALLASPRPAE